MKWLSFLWYVLQNGSLFEKPVDFDNLRRGVLNREIQSKSIYIRIRNRFAKSRWFGTLIGNTAYLKSLNRINRNYFFVDSLSLGYVRILKSASTSVLRELLPRMNSELTQSRLTDEEVDQLAAQYVTHIIEKPKQRYQLFAIVRNPFQRLVSVYQDIFNPDNKEFAYRTYLFGILKEKMSFYEFVVVLSRIPDKLKSSHFVSQSEIIKQCEHVSDIRIFRLEKDKVQMEEFLSKYQISIGHRNKGTQYDYHTFYDEETLRLAYLMYKNDVEKFGYQEEFDSLRVNLSSSRIGR
jgi:hypothetical protein